MSRRVTSHDPVEDDSGVLLLRTPDLDVQQVPGVGQGVVPLHAAPAAPASDDVKVASVSHNSRALPVTQQLSILRRYLTDLAMLRGAHRVQFVPSHFSTTSRSVLVLAPPTRYTVSPTQPTPGLSRLSLVPSLPSQPSHMSVTGLQEEKSDSVMINIISYL